VRYGSRGGDCGAGEFRACGSWRAGLCGSADSLASGSADLIVANISPAWIAELAAEWVRILKPGGVAILSGFEAGEVPVVSAAIAKAGGTVAGEFGELEWRMIEIRS